MNKKGTINTTRLLQVAVVFLAVVSFFTTANGMREYIFNQNSAIAYMASAAIQGILLALSMNLPGYLRRIWKNGWNGFIRFLLCLFTVLLTGVAVFCSSWFSYVYIAEVIHKDSWGTDSELLVQQTYRTELYAARDYAHTYRIYLEGSVGEKIILLESQARHLDNSMVDFGLDWQTERDTYVKNVGETAASYMAPVINAMEKAAQNSSSQENRDLAAKAVSDAKENITAKIAEVQQEIDTLDNNITMFRTQITNLTINIRNATEDTDTASLYNSINTYTQLIETTTQQQVALEVEKTQLRTALGHLPIYESYLGLHSSTSAISIRNELMQMQSEFFKPEPDKEVLLKIATNIFDNLRNASNGDFGAVSADPSAEPTDAGQEDKLSTTSLLIQMNQLIRNLTDYTEVKDIEATLDNLIMELRVDDPSAAVESEAIGSIAPIESINPADPAESVEPTATEPAEPSEPVESAEPSPAAESSSPAGLSSDAPAGEQRWQDIWGTRLERLKAQVSAMPTYSESDLATTDTNIASGSQTSSILSESQISILRSYDRNQSSRNLDDMIRRYISNHSAIYQGIIYLQSPYRSLALFALLLALAFDLTGFVFGVVIEGIPQQRQDGDIVGNAPTSAISSVEKQDTLAEWTILETMQRYMVLTGDHEFRDGIYHYKVFRDGILCEWPVQDSTPYTGKIYIQDKAVPETGISVTVEQALCFANQSGGPKDGVYMNCRLVFDEGSLIAIQNGQPQFIATVNEYVPVHSYDSQKGEGHTIPAKQLAEKNVDAEIAVVALNTRGTQIAAIYAIKA